MVKRKKGRPSLTGETTDNDNNIPRTKSKTEKYDKTMCIICQKPDGHTCKVAFKETGKTMLLVAQKLSDKTLFIWLNTITHADDTIANDVLYYNLCWAKAKRLAEPIPKPVENYAKTLADIELLNIIETNIHQNTYNTLDMNFINKTCVNTLIENNADPKEISNNYKKQLKELISVNLPDLLFAKSTQKNKPEQLISPAT